METRASYLLVGVFMLTLMAGLFGFVLWLAKASIRDDHTYYYIYFRDSVSGLQEGSAVRLRGVPVGTVADIAIDRDNVELIQVTVALKAGTPIKTDTVASLQLQGITGLSFVQLTGGTQAAPVLEPRPGKRRAVIAARPSALEQVFESAPEILTQIMTLAARGNELLSDHNQKNIADILSHLGTFTGALARSSGGIEAIVAEAAVTVGTLGEVAHSLDGLARDLKVLTKAIGGDATRVADGAERTLAEFGGAARTIETDAARVANRAERTLAELAAAARTIETMAAEFQRLAADAREPVRDFARTGLYDLSQFIVEARSLVTGLTRLASQMERDPARFLFGDQQRGFEAR
ncbi:MAG: MlaD family protein [Pseudomonadota bacterium]